MPSLSIGRTIRLDQTGEISFSGLEAEANDEHWPFQCLTCYSILNMPRWLPPERCRDRTQHSALGTAMVLLSALPMIIVIEFFARVGKLVMETLYVFGLR